MECGGEKTENSSLFWKLLETESNYTVFMLEVIVFTNDWKKTKLLYPFI